MAILDSRAYSIPSIVTPVGGIPDIAVHKKNTLLFEPGNIEQLAECLEELNKDTKLQETLSKESIFLSKQKFSISVISEQLDTIYYNL